MAADLAALGRWLKKRIKATEFREFLAGSLLEMCRIDTIPIKNLEDTRRREERFFGLIEDLITRHGLPGRLERSPIPRRITTHPFYTFPHYAGTEDAYSGRGNLLYLLDAPPPDGGAATGGRADNVRRSGLAVNAHIDTVAPYSAAGTDGRQVWGRGACDDKGGCAVMVGALRLLQELEQSFGIIPDSDLTFMFVIDEEMGGNGSLALAINEKLSERYGTMVVLECCDGQVHPGGRGAIWYRVEIPTFQRKPPESLRAYNPLLLAMEIIRSMDGEGMAIRAESDHPLFARTAVQTSPGILGPYGEHPARICASVAFELGGRWAEDGLNRLESRLQEGLEEYIRRYGDRCVGEQPGAGLRRHYDLVMTATGNIELHVHGLSGHMGALHRSDNALIKAAYLMETLKCGPEVEGERWGIRLLDQPSGSPLLLEGGQGFVPTHSMEQIKTRLSGAVQRAYRRYSRYTWKRVPYFRDATPRVSFAKLHNEAFQSDAAAPAVMDAVSAAEEAGIDVHRPLLGWEVSSDARIFAHLRPDLSVFTTGPGKLALAHSDEEKLDIDELCSGVLMLTLFLLRHGGFRGTAREPADAGMAGA